MFLWTSPYQGVGFLIQSLCGRTNKLLTLYTLFLFAMLSLLVHNPKAFFSSLSRFIWLTVPCSTLLPRSLSYCRPIRKWCILHKVNSSGPTGSMSYWLYTPNHKRSFFAYDFPVCFLPRVIWSIYPEDLSRCNLVFRGCYIFLWSSAIFVDSWWV